MPTRSNGTGVPSDRVLLRRARVVKSFGLGTLVASAALLAPLTYLLAVAWGPQVTTMYLHYNVQYRAGDLEVENVILNESLRAMVTMMDRHPNWHYSIEIQAYGIERLLNEPEAFPGLLALLQRQNQRGQLEILCSVYSSQIVAGYPRYALDVSYNLTREVLDRANLTQSRALVHQEGQVTAGLAVALAENPNTRVDTIIVSRQQVDDFWPGGKPTWKHPVQRLAVGGHTVNLLVYDYLPRREAGVFHGWVWTLDAELAIEKQDDADYEFQVDPGRVRDFERQWEALERHGNRFLTVEEWVDHCEENGYVEDLPHYQPTTHWGPTMYDTCYTWYGNDQGATDDGAMIATLYRSQALLRATELMSQKWGNLLNASAVASVAAHLAAARRSQVLAMVTDTTGITPKSYEREYGYRHATWVLLNCSAVARLLQWELASRGIEPALATAPRLVVDLATGDMAPWSQGSALAQVVEVLDPATDPVNDSLPFVVTASVTNTENSTATRVERVDVEGVGALRYSATFPGTNEWQVDSVDYSVRFAGAAGEDLFSEVQLAVSLAEDLPLVTLRRADYTPDAVLKFHLATSNGLVFVPSSPGGDAGTAIVWNCSSYHVAPYWTGDALTFHSSGGIHLDAPFEFYFLANVTNATARAFANRVNVEPRVVASADPRLASGWQFLEEYGACVKETKEKGEEWWQDLF